MTNPELLDRIKTELLAEIEEIRRVRRQWKRKYVFFKYTTIILSSLVPLLLGLRAWVATADFKEGLAVAAFVVGAIAACLNTLDSANRPTEMYVHYCKSLTLHELLMSEILYQEKKGKNGISEKLADSWHRQMHELRKMTLNVWSELRITKRRDIDHSLSEMGHDSSDAQGGTGVGKKLR